MIIRSHEHYMQQAFKEATYAYEEDEVPIGAVIVCNNQIIAKGYNQVERLKDVTAHAEMIAITSAANYLGSKFLEQCTMYITIEPCLMCATALYWARIGTLVYGSSEPKFGYSRHSNVLHPSTQVVAGVLENECGNLMRSFFQAKRK
jgi:tRNA(adenine34) deaminase